MQKTMGRPRRRRHVEQKSFNLEHSLDHIIRDMGSGPDSAYYDGPETEESDAFNLVSQCNFSPDLTFEEQHYIGNMQMSIDNTRSDKAITSSLNSDEFSPDNQYADSAQVEIPSDEHSCACLSTIYLELSDLNSMSNYSFPAALLPLQNAMDAAKKAIECRICPRDAISAMQNLHLIITLLWSIAERFQKVVHAIDIDAEILRETGEARSFQFCDTSTALSHMHLASANRSATFSLDLQAEDWQQMAKKVIQNNVKYQPYGSGNRSLQGLMSQLETRQASWHTDNEMMKRMSGTQPDCFSSIPMRDMLCMRMLDSVRNMTRKIGL